MRYSKMEEVVADLSSGGLDLAHSLEADPTSFQARPDYDGAYFSGDTAFLYVRDDFTYGDDLSGIYNVADPTRDFCVQVSVQCATGDDLVRVYLVDWATKDQMILEEICGPINPQGVGNAGNIVKSYAMPKGYDLAFESVQSGKFSPPTLYGTK